MNKLTAIGTFIIFAAVGGIQTATADDNRDSDRHQDSRYERQINDRFVGRRAARRIPHINRVRHHAQRVRLHRPRHTFAGLRHSSGLRWGLNPGRHGYTVTVRH